MQATFGAAEAAPHKDFDALTQTLQSLCNDGRIARPSCMKYDAIVIGSGQAGVPLALRLADIGWQVALIEKSSLGGTCINNGCTPTKTMVHRAQVAYYARNAVRWGVRASDVSADLEAIVAQKNKVVHSFRDGREKQVKRRTNLHFYSGQTRFVGVPQDTVVETLLES